MGSRRIWACGVAVLAAWAAPATAQVYRPGLLALYATFRPNNSEAPFQDQLRRVDAYPWFYNVGRPLRSGDIDLKVPSDYPWPEDVRQQVNLRSMVVYWSGFLFVPKAGSYGFQLLASQQAELHLDDQKVVTHELGFYHREGRAYAVTPPTVGTAKLAGGMHKIELMYLNIGYSSGVFLRWQRPGDEQFSAIPPESLVHDPNGGQAMKAPTNKRQGPKLLGSGTGFVVHPNGWLLTCHHVVNGEGTPSVLLGDQELPAEVVSTDARRDLALIKIERTGLSALGLADGKQVGRQDEVLCFGYPLADVLGLDLSSENGRITALREKEGLRALQTNAPVKPGNSGGPMVNLKAEVVGVISNRLELGGKTEGVAFAVPIDYAAGLMARIPDFKPVFGTGQATMTAGEVDKRVSPGVLPILVRETGTAKVKAGQ